MEDNPTEFSEAEKARIDQLLLESLESFARGEGQALRPGEIEAMVERKVRDHRGRGPDAAHHVP